MRNLIGVTAAVVRRPDLWGTSLSLVLRLIPDRPFRRGPFPPGQYLRYRGQAVYGMPLSLVPAVDFIRYLEWCKSFPGPVC